MNTIKKLLLLLCLVTYGAAQAQAQNKKVYAVFTYSIRNLCFFYEENYPGSDNYKKVYRIADPSSLDWLELNSSIQSVTFDSSFADYHPTSTASWFSGCYNLDRIKFQNLNTDMVTDMSYMFSGCSKLTSLDLSSFNTANVTNMNRMFGLCSTLTSLDLSSFNTANVTDMSYMFYYCSSLTSLDLSSFNTANVANMKSMFEFCYKLTSLDVSNFNTANVTDMSGMFSGCKLTSLDVSNFNTTNVTNMNSMFYNCSSLKGISCNDTWTPTSSTYMFYNCTSLSSRTSGLSYDTNKTDGTYANPYTGYFTGGNAYATYSPNDNTLTFYFDGEKDSRPGTSYDLNAVGSVPDWLTYASSIHHVVFDSSMDIVRPKNMNSWFAMLRNLTDITGLQYLHTENVTSMTNMFGGCTSLTSLDLSTFNTENVTSMGNMFIGCTGLTTLNLSSFNTANVTTMSGMFNGCTGLMTIIVGDEWSTSAVTSSTNLFNECTSIIGRYGTRYDANHIDIEYARIDDAPTSPGYLSDTSNPTSTVTLQLSILGEGTLTLLDSGTEVASFTGESTATADWTRGNNLRLVATCPQGFDLTNAQAYIIVDGNNQQMTKTTDAGNNPYFVYDMNNIICAHSFTLVLTGLGSAVESNMAITVSGSGTVECVVLKNDGTSSYTRVESNEYKEASYYPDEVDDGAVVFVFSKPQAGQTLKVFRNGMDVTGTLIEQVNGEITTYSGGFTLNTTYMAMCPWGAITPSSIMAVYENNATHTLLLAGEQVGKALVYWLDEDGITLDDFEANAEEPYATMWDTMDDVVSARLIVKDIPEGYTFKAYFNGVEITDFTINQSTGSHNAILDGETIKKDGTWLVNFFKEGGDNPEPTKYEVTVSSTTGGETKVYYTNPSDGDTYSAFFNNENTTQTYTIKSKTDVRFEFTPIQGCELELVVAGSKRMIGEGCDVVPQGDGSYVFTLPASDFYNGRANVVVYYKKRNGDVNDDGDVDISDVTKLVNEILEKSQDGD